MDKLIFFTNVRADGGVRTGIELNDQTIFHQFIQGPRPTDPALDWFVDIVCESKNIPSDPPHAKSWLLVLAPVINQGLRELVGRFQLGLDEPSYPFSHRVKKAPAGTRITIKGSALRRIRATEIGGFLAQVLDAWEDSVSRLPAA
jgi:hypothetical protein